MNKITGLMIIEVVNSNPNGDLSGRPRQDIDDRGIISSVSVKRKIRNTIGDHQSSIFNELKNKFDLNPDNYHVFDSQTRGYDVDDPVKALQMSQELYEKSKSQFLERYVDQRLFGGTNLWENFGKKEKQKKEDRISNALFAGSVSFNEGFSLNTIQIYELDITKRYPIEQKADNLKNDNGTIANGGIKKVQYGLYAMPFGVCPHNAKKVGLTLKDLEVLKFILPRTFDFSVSVTRPQSSVRVRNCYWAEHKSPIGTFHEYNFLEEVMPKLKIAPTDPATSINDYVIADVENINPIYNCKDLTLIG